MLLKKLKKLNNYCYFIGLSSKHKKSAVKDFAIAYGAPKVSMI
ncbi:hypothetical protein N0Y54_33445 [Nostoc punctiforme UO1]